MAAVTIRDKRILLVGATGVLGRAYSHALGEAGARLVLADLAASGVEDLARTLACSFVTLDLSDEGAVVRGVEEAQTHLGTFDGVVANAAITGEALTRMGAAFAPFEEYPLDLWKKTLDVNLTGTFLLAREAGKRMKMTGGGSFVTVSSIYGLQAPDHRIYEGEKFRSFPAYSASKAGVVGLTRWLATWWAQDNLRVNCLVPGGVFNGQNESFVRAYSNRIPLGRMAQPEDMTGMLVYLLSDASRYCTGGVYTVDGGLGAW
ncbi:MAG TPA: SDR family oxidoreductase [Alphaproteobacteria bacterium]|jgi:NAD(P)-dependent dehydrogenase (short-subunit alcohol dehydrogenase family)|nr:SDR family oxidoreductase [Alphaproteobacteria bacterium]